MAGRPCNMERITEIARAKGIRVIEDACQGVGGSYQGRRLGSIGDCGAFSFNQFKNIACGEGGALFTSDGRIHERALIYHDMGCGFRSHAGEVSEPLFLGTNFRLNEILGAFLNVQLDRLESILDRLRQRRQWVLDAVRGQEKDFEISPSADHDGDCGCEVSFLFESAEARRAVAERLSERESACRLASPIDSGLHVYTNWTVLLNQRGGHHPQTNPYEHPANRECRKEIAPEDCRRTLDLLARTGTIRIGIGWNREECGARAADLCEAARETAAKA
jgi:dTDP-4-amino-4,6-dideoxygalactose transaminase